VTELELISMLGHGEKEGTIEPTERKIIERVFEFNDLTVRDVMTPHNDLFSLNGDLTVAEALPKVAGKTYSRIPLYEKDPHSIDKVLYMRDLLVAVASNRESDCLKDIAHTPIFVTQYLAIDELFNQMIKSKRHLCIVVDEHGAIRGVATLEDLLEELVGEIYDESDVQTGAIEQVSENEMVIDAAEELRIIKEFFKIDLPGKPTDTIRLWILTHIECIPEEKEVFFIDGFEITILKATPRQIDRVRVRRPD